MATNLTSSKYPSTSNILVVSNGGWGNASNACLADGVYSNTTPARNSAVASKWTGFDFSAVPDNANITAFSIDTRWYTSATTSSTVKVEVFSGGTSVGSVTYPANTTVSTTNFVVPGVPTMAQLKAVNGISVNVTASRTGSTSVSFYLDFIQAKVVYDVPAGSVDLNPSTITATASAKNPSMSITPRGLFEGEINFNSGWPPGTVLSSDTFPSYAPLLTEYPWGSGLYEVIPGNSQMFDTQATSSWLEIPVTFNYEGSLSFGYYFESEWKYDTFRVYLDGTVILSANGYDSPVLGTNYMVSVNAYPTNTVYPSFNATYKIDVLSAGTHTLKFEYTKNASNDVGADKFQISKINYSWVEPTTSTGITVDASSDKASAQGLTLNLSNLSVVNNLSGSMPIIGKTVSLLLPTGSITRNATGSIPIISASGGISNPPTGSAVKDRTITGELPKATGSALSLTGTSSIPLTVTNLSGLPGASANAKDPIVTVTDPIVTNPLTVDITSVALIVTAQIYTPTVIYTNGSSVSHVTDNLQIYLDAQDFTNSPQTTTWTDKSGNGNNGTVVNFQYTSTSGTDGNGGVAFNATGNNDYVKFADSPSITGNYITAELLLKNTSNSSYSSLLSKGAYQSYGWYVNINSPANNVGITVSNGTTASTSNFPSYFTDLNYVHFAFTLNKVTLEVSLYKNGVLFGTSTITNADGWLDYTNELTLGNYNTVSTSGNWKGSLKLFRLYNRVLSQEEIAQNYESTQTQVGANSTITIPCASVTAEANLPTGAVQKNLTTNLTSVMISNTMQVNLPSMTGQKNLRADISGNLIATGSAQLPSGTAIKNGTINANTIYASASGQANLLSGTVIKNLTVNASTIYATASGQAKSPTGLSSKDLSLTLSPYTVTASILQPALITAQKNTYLSTNTISVGASILEPTISTSTGGSINLDINTLSVSASLKLPSIAFIKDFTVDLNSLTASGASLLPTTSYVKNATLNIFSVASAVANADTYVDSGSRMSIVAQNNLTAAISTLSPAVTLKNITFNAQKYISVSLQTPLASASAIPLNLTAPTKAGFVSEDIVINSNKQVHDVYMTGMTVDILINFRQHSFIDISRINALSIFKCPTINV